MLEKAKAALQYCAYASDHNLQNGGKTWKCLLIPHSEVLPNMSFGYLARKRQFANQEEVLCHSRVCLRSRRLMSYEY